MEKKIRFTSRLTPRSRPYQPCDQETVVLPRRRARIRMNHEAVEGLDGRLDLVTGIERTVEVLVYQPEDGLPVVGSHVRDDAETMGILHRWLFYIVMMLLFHGRQPGIPLKEKTYPPLKEMVSPFVNVQGVSLGEANK